MSIVLRMLLVTAAAAFTGTSHAVLVARYEFNETSGDISSAVNTGVSGSIAPWGADLDTTLSGGNLVVNGQLNFQPGSPSFGGILQGSNVITSGSAFLRIDFASWGPSTSNQFFAFGLRAKPGGSANQSWRLQLATGEADGDPAARITEVPTFSMNDDDDLVGGDLPTNSAISSEYPNGLSVIMGINLDNDTTSVWWDANRTGTYSILDGRLNVAIDSTNGFTNFTLIDSIQLSSSNGPFAVDRLVLGTNFAEIAAIPEASQVVAFGALSGAIAMATWLRSRTARIN